MAARNPNPLHITPLPGIPEIINGDNLAKAILVSLSQIGLQLIDGDIIAIAQKIVSKAEGRVIELSTVTPSIEAINLSKTTGKDPRLVQLILSESTQVIRKRVNLIIVKHRLGFVCANAGIDQSNVSQGEGNLGEKVILLPKNPDLSAKHIRDRLESASRARLGVLIIDSHGRAWRMGAIGSTIGISGIPGVADLRGRPDLFGYQLQSTQVGVADELAAGASLIMGQADEGTPFVHVRGFPYPLRESALHEILRSEEDNLFQ